MGNGSWSKLLSSSLMSALIGALVASGVSAVLSYYGTSSLQLAAYQMETTKGMFEVKEYQNPDALIFNEVTSLMKVAIFMPREVLRSYHEVEMRECFNEIREECIPQVKHMLNAYRDAIGTGKVEDEVMETIVRSMQKRLEMLPSRQ